MKDLAGSMEDLYRTHAELRSHVGDLGGPIEDLYRTHMKDLVAE